MEGETDIQNIGTYSCQVNVTDSNSVEDMNGILYDMLYFELKVEED